MLDIKFIAEHPDKVKRDLTKRNDLEKIKWVDDVIKLYKRYGKLVYDLQRLRAKRNQVSTEIAKRKGTGQETGLLLEQMKTIPQRIRKKEEVTEKLKEKIDWYLLRLPNIMHKSVPRGVDESQNVEVRRWGAKPKLGFKPLDHIDITEKLGLVDIDRAAKVAGRGSTT